MGYKEIKGFIEPIIAFFSIILLSPLFFITALVVKLDSEGPTIFKQKRVGHNRKVFTLYKFRTMVKNAEKLKENYKHLNYADGPVFKIINDPRLTRVGKILTKMNIDELPQLFNVVKGDMHFVGFRPHPVKEVAKYKKWHMERFKGYPGMTSKWAVEGMHNIKFDDWMRMDIDYAKNESLFLDLEILGKTGLTILKGFGQVLRGKRGCFRH